MREKVLLGARKLSHICVAEREYERISLGVMAIVGFALGFYVDPIMLPSYRSFTSNSCLCQPDADGLAKGLP